MGLTKKCSHKNAPHAQITRPHDFERAKEMWSQQEPINQVTIKMSTFGTKIINKLMQCKILFRCLKKNFPTVQKTHPFILFQSKSMLIKYCHKICILGSNYLMAYNSAYKHFEIIFWCLRIFFVQIWNRLQKNDVHIFLLNPSINKLQTTPLDIFYDLKIYYSMQL